MNKRVLVTGAAGFTGRYMCEYLHNIGRQLDVIGIDIFEPKDGCSGQFVVADMTCGKSLGDVVENTRPDYVIHLAGTFGGDDCLQIYRDNVLSMVALLEAVVKYMPDSVVVATGSAAEYGRIAQRQLPVREDCLCEPVTPYGLSKLLATQIAFYYHRVHNTNVTVLRPFQLIGKGVSSRLAPGAFLEQLRTAIKNGSGLIRVGNLESSRDFLDINDAAAGIWALCEKPAAGEVFNLCSGRPTKLSDLLDMMIKASGAKVKVEIDSARLRGKSDVSVVYGSFSKIHKHCGWYPTKELGQSISNLFI